MTGRALALVLVSASLPALAAEPATRRPNVIVILADDLGFSDLGSSGGEIDTPNLDRLAAGGLRFTQGYDTARCWPTRAALLTGYYPQAIGRDALPGGPGGAQGKRPEWAKLLPERLAAAGYRSYHSGKWHVDGDPRAQGFARSLDVAGAGQSNYFDAGGVTDDGKPRAAPPGFYTTTAIGDHAVECLAAHARDHAGTPFFHYVAFTAPHFPLQAPADLVAKYRDRYRVGWDAVRSARCRRVRESGIVTTPPASPEPDVGPPYQPDANTLARLGPGEVDRPRPWVEITDEQREFQAAKMAVHAAMVEAMDREVGRIVAQLEAMHALDDTFLLFLSDNGASAEIMIRGEGHDPTAPLGSRKTFVCLGPGWSTVANAPFRRHKTWVHEGGIATPWIVHWPRGIAVRGELRTQPVHAIDVVPTVLEIARAPEQQARAVPPLQGRSFARTLADPAAPPAHDSLWWCHEGHRAVRVGDWKLVAVKGGPWELYDLAADRCETDDLAATHRDRVVALEREWNRIAAECRGAAPAAAADRPNFVVIFIDDLGIPYSNDMQKVSAETGERVVPLVRHDKVAELLTDEAQRGIVERSTDEAVAFIRESKDKPFFLYLPHTAVHLPHFPGERFRGKSGNGAFGDWVAEMDWSVGRVLEALREHGLDISGLLLGTATESPREAHDYFAGDALEAVRQGRWKLAIAGQPQGMGRKGDKVPASPETPRLYDLEVDVGETTDVSATHPDVVARLRGLALAMRAELSDRGSSARRPPGRVEWPQMLYPVKEKPAEKTPAAAAPAQQPGKRKPVRAASFRQPADDAPFRQPNVVLFLADDLGWGELGCYGNRAAVTPHLDRFAAQGLKLTDCHSASSVCSPSRSALLTGRTPYRNGVFTWIPEGSPIHLRTNEVTLPKLLREAGYDTCHVGKWHLNGKFNSPEQPQPDAHGYAWWLATQNNAAPSHAFPENFVRNGAPVGKADEYSAPFIAKEAVMWLNETWDRGRPFFLTVWTHEPHYPIASADRYEKIHAGVADPEERTYRANVTQLDDAFGTVMKALDDLAVADDTLVIFTSDNGPEGDGTKGPGRGLTGGLRGRKRSMYEGGHRVPGLIRWPAEIEPGTTSDLPVIGSDFFPTVLAAARVEPPAGVTLDGVDCSGPRVHEPRPLYWRWGGSVAYREGPWKIVVDEKLEKPQLYDLSADRAEATDLAAREPARLAAMMERLRAYTAEIEAEGPDWWRTEPGDGRRRANPAGQP